MTSSRRRRGPVSVGAIGLSLLMCALAGSAARWGAAFPLITKADCVNTNSSAPPYPDQIYSDLWGSYSPAGQYIHVYWQAIHNCYAPSNNPHPYDFFSYNLGQDSRGNTNSGPYVNTGNMATYARRWDGCNGVPERDQGAEQSNIAALNWFFSDVPYGYYQPPDQAGSPSSTQQCWPQADNHSWGTSTDGQFSWDGYIHDCGHTTCFNEQTNLSPGPCCASSTATSLTQDQATAEAVHLASSLAAAMPAITMPMQITSITRAPSLGAIRDDGSGSLLYRASAPVDAWVVTVAGNPEPDGLPLATGLFVVSSNGDTTSQYAGLDATGLNLQAEYVAGIVHVINHPIPVAAQTPTLVTPYPVVLDQLDLVPYVGLGQYELATVYQAVKPNYCQFVPLCPGP